MSDVLKPNQQDDIRKLNQLIKDIEVCMMTTLNEQNVMHSRPMVTQEIDDNGDLWFITGDHTAKVTEVEQREKVNLNYSLNKKNQYVAVTGSASVVHDREKIKKLWKSYHQVWFPQGPEDPNLALLRVEAEMVEYWAGTPSAGEKIFGIAKAIVTGESLNAHPDGHGKIDLAG
jgi:general stress protein 26